MKIVVCVKQVPDTAARVVVEDGQVTWGDAPLVINPWDELALTRALELKDNSAAGVKTVTVAHVGLATAEPTIRKALAIGADDAVRVNLDPKDAYQVATQLAEVVKNEQYDIILCGIESSDFNGSTVGSMVAELLEYPSVSAISGLSIENGNTVITREIDGGKETVSVPTPFVAIVQKGIAKEPRIAAMRGIMQARTKVIKVVEPVSVDALSEVVSFEPPQPRAKCIFVDAENPQQLVELLQNEAKVL